ncbi:hypothetical protein OG225_05065 [Nocardia sp. NBC_01377]|uniref:hypothetical protein n=1 Tax=Nocardia sp. NBC_01377 TaxID=2903595 RepID=UPI00324F38B1
MSRRIPVLVAVISATVLANTGCVSIAAPDKQSDAATCVSEFHLGDTEGPLGSMFKFSDRAIDAAAAGTSTTFRELTRSVGWRDDWDRVVDVPQDITAAELDRRAGTAGVCWKSLPRRTGSEYDGPRHGYYLFLNGNQPIQSTPWFDPGQRPFDFQGRDQIFADTPLVRAGSTALRPE